MELYDLLELCFDKAPEDAVAFLESQGIQVSGSYKDQLEIIKQHAFTVAKVECADLLETIKSALDNAMNEGKTFEQFKKEVVDTIPDKTNWRTIYNTNMTSAYNAGRFYAQKEAVSAFPYWRHNCVIDSRTRPLGRELNGKVYRQDDPHWSTYYPPNEYNDRDRITTLSDADVKAMGLKVENAPPELNGKTLSPDQSFQSNPTQRWKPDLNKYSPGIRQQLEKTLGDEFAPVKTIADAQRVISAELGDNSNYGKLMYKHPKNNLNPDGSLKNGAIIPRNADLSVVNELIPVIKEFRIISDKLGINKLRLINMKNDMNYNGLMGEGALSVRLKRDPPDKNSWKIGDPLKDRAWSASTSSDASKSQVTTLWHEFGHHIDQQIPGLAKEVSQFKLQLRQEGKSVVNPTMISDKNTREWFAENYALYKMGRESICDPNLIDLMKMKGILP